VSQIRSPEKIEWPKRPGGIQPTPANTADPLAGQTFATLNVRYSMWIPVRINRLADNHPKYGERWLDAEKFL
jgi:hypothetical protein